MFGSRARDSWMSRSCRGWGKGNGASNTCSTTLNMAVVVPTPTAKVSIAIKAAAGRLRSIRRAKAVSRVALKSLITAFDALTPRRLVEFDATRKPQGDYRAQG